MSKVLQAFLRQTKRIPDTLNKYATQNVVDTEYGIIYPAFRGIDKEEVLQDFRLCLPNFKSFSATFHKSWEVIEDTDQGNLYMQAVMHYITTYGFENLGIDADGYTYIPEEECEIPELRKFKVLKRITTEETIEFIENTLYNTSIGLSKQTIEDLITMAEEVGLELDVNAIVNKETQTFLALKTGLIPSRTEDMVRLLFAIHTGDTTLINDKERWASYCTRPLSPRENDLMREILELRATQLASVFYRYRKMFYSIRKRGFKKQINWISNHAKDYWEPKAGKEFLTTRILKGKGSVKEINALSLVDLIKVYNRLNEVVYCYEEHLPYYRAFVVRNGKVYVQAKDKKITESEYQNAKRYTAEILDLINMRVNQNTLVVVPDNMNYAFPTSEKSFIGDIPLFTIAKTSGANVVGISWNREDIDLSGILKDGIKIGWNGTYSKNNVMYSGDMTRAVCTNKECKNYLKINGQDAGVCPDCGQPLYAAEAIKLDTDNSVLLMSNLFNMETSPLDLFLATFDNDSWEDAHKSSEESYNNKFIVDPNNIVFTAKLQQDTRSKSLGVFYKQGEENSFAFANLGIGNSNVSFGSDVMAVAIDVIKIKAESALKLSDIFNVYTGEEYEEYLNDTEDMNPDTYEELLKEIREDTVDLRNGGKDGILGLIVEQ